MDLENFGKYIKKIRIEKGLTQKELGDKLGVSIQAVSKWEHGLCMPDIVILREMSKMLNININDLLEGKESKTRKKFNKMWIIIIVIVILFVIFGGIVLYKNINNGFEVKMISTTCKDFTLEGFAAYDHKKTAIHITEVNYCGEENNDVYEKVTCNLYEDYNDTSTLVSPCDATGESVTLEEFLKDVEINVTDYSAACKKFVESTLSIHINALQQDGKTVVYTIPVAFEDNC